MIVNKYSIQYQKGVVTIVTAVVLLIVITILALLTARVVIFETRVTANEVRAVESFENTMTGLTSVLSTYNNSADPADRTIVGLASKKGYDMEGNLIWEVEGVEKAGWGLRVRLRGYSADSTASSIVEQVIMGTASLAGPLSTPLTSKGTVGISGSGIVINPEGNFTVWTGMAVDFTQNASGVNDGFTMVKHPTEDGTIKSSDRNYIGSDVIDADTALSSLTDDEMFENFISGTEYDAGYATGFDFYKDTIVTMIVDGDDADLSGVVDSVILVNGNLGLNGGIIGTADQPVILVVDGNLDMTGNPEIYGVVYVRGNLNEATGTPKITGSLIVEGDAPSTGNVKVVYDSSTVGNAGRLGPAIFMPGSWRDWQD